MTFFEDVRTIANRTGSDVDAVIDFAEEFRHIHVGAVCAYLEKRIANLIGDENPRFELEQIRRDLALLSTLTTPEVRHAVEAGRKNADENS